MRILNLQEEDGINTLMPIQSGLRLTDNIFKIHFLKWKLSCFESNQFIEVYP